MIAVRHVGPTGHPRSNVLRLPLAPAEPPPPPVEPLEFLKVDPATARQINALVPFSTTPNVPAAPYKYAGSEEDRARAVGCLAAAEWYEAGSDPEGERAVAQVVLNRARHPAFPNSICGVVFQGSGRQTGCQFTFTCDGALNRVPSKDAWLRSVEIANAALSGSVDPTVGLATHYHTDWVAPNWSSSLEKITNVHTHLFYRWKGGWGKRGAFRSAYLGSEPRMTQIAFLTDAHKAVSGTESATVLSPVEVLGNAQLAIATLDPALAAINLRGNALRLIHPQGGAYGLLLDRGAPSGSFSMVALDLCRGRPYCKVMGWIDPLIVPTRFPVPSTARDALAFLYVHDAHSGQEMILWDCAIFKRPSKDQCLVAGQLPWDTAKGGKGSLASLDN